MGGTQGGMPPEPLEDLSSRLAAPPEASFTGFTDLGGTTGNGQLQPARKKTRRAATVGEGMETSSLRIITRHCQCLTCGRFDDEPDPVSGVATDAGLTTGMRKKINRASLLPSLKRQTEACATGA